MNNWIDKLKPALQDLARVVARSIQASEGINPVCLMMQEQPEMIEDWHTNHNVSITALTRIAIAFQMKIYDETNGPESDGALQTIRNHWYHWFKIQFAQPFSKILGENMDDGKWGRRWAGRISKEYGWFVDKTDTIYTEMWVEDQSRMIKFWPSYNDLFKNANLILAVEKNGMFQKFIPMAKAMGARAIISGAGKNSKAAMEGLLMKAFEWSRSNHPFSKDFPLTIIHISDHDYDGEEVIGLTFGEQARRYTPHVQELRLGIHPAHIEAEGFNLMDKWFQVRMTDKAYTRWAELEGMWEYTCPQCNSIYARQGLFAHPCPHCGIPIHLSDCTKIPYGFEVEALNSRAFYALVADAIEKLFGYSEIVERLRAWTQPDIFAATIEARKEYLKDHSSYQAAIARLAELDDLKSAVEHFEIQLDDKITPFAEARINEYQHIGEDPDMADFDEHIKEADEHTYTWNPFDSWSRTLAMTSDLEMLVTATDEEGIRADEMGLDNISHDIDDYL